MTRAPPAVLDVFDAAWNRATPWTELLADSVRIVSAALPRSATADGVPVSTSILFVQQHAQRLVAACRRLSRWGTFTQALSDVWTDVVTQRQKGIIGSVVPHTCPLCNAAFPSAQACAAHMHKRHSVINVLTRYTNGTVCLWCNTEHHSTDRLKYHLKTTPNCVHGLRVVVGQQYEHGTGTKRSGPRAHRGLPPIRIAGPLNATPAQRAACLEGRACTAAEIAQELLQSTGTRDVYQWPPDCPQALAVDGGPPIGESSPAPALPAASMQALPAAGAQHAPVRWVSLLPLSEVREDDLNVPSPFWPGLLHRRLPASFRALGIGTGVRGRPCIPKNLGPWTFIGRCGLLGMRAFLHLALLTGVHRSPCWIFSQPRSAFVLSASSLILVVWHGSGVCLRGLALHFCVLSCRLPRFIPYGRLWHSSSSLPVLPALPRCGNRSCVPCFPLLPKGGLPRFVLYTLPLFTALGR